MDENKKISDFKSLNMVLFELERNLRKRLQVSVIPHKSVKSLNRTQKMAYLDMFIVSYIKRKTLTKLIEQSPEDVNTRLYVEQRDQCERLMLTIYNDVMCIPNVIIREIIFQIFILGRSTEQTAFNVYYSQRQTERLKAQGLELLKITWTETDEEDWTSHFVTSEIKTDKEV